MIDVSSEHSGFLQFTEHVYRAVMFLLQEVHLMTICMYTHTHTHIYIYIYTYM